jgi:hypothetical protein
MVASANYLTLGMGNAIASATADFDDLLVYDRPLTAQDVKLLYSRERRVTDFAAGIHTGISEPTADSSCCCHADKFYYDLSGRRISNPVRPGFYIHQGKKVITK